MGETLWQVTAPHFVAGIVLAGDLCVEAAPILGWCRGRQRVYLRDYFQRRGWQVQLVAKLETT